MSLIRKLIIMTLFILMIGLSIWSYLDQTRGPGITFLHALYYGTLNIVVVSLVMMIVPIGIRLLKGAPLGYSFGRTVSLWNSLIMFIITLALIVLRVISNSFIDITSVLVFFYINLWIITADNSQID